MRRLAALGPGLLMAGAAIGVSHLVQSTRAGASFGFELLPVILFANAIKYPLFKIGHLYTSQTKENLLAGYLRLGKNWLWLFVLLNFLIGIITVAAVTLVTAGISVDLLPGLSAVSYASFALLALSFLLIFRGGYSAVERVIKVFLVLLCLTSLTAAGIAVSGWEPSVVENSERVTLIFLLALMGWMPAPLECSVWQSLWLEEKYKSNPEMTESDVIFDFNFSYALTTFMAVLFLTLGAVLMFGSGEQFSNSPIQFSGQLVNLYTSVLGHWTAPIIAICAFVAMLSTTLTVVDAYPRSVHKGLELLKVNMFSNKQIFTATCIGALVIILAFSDALKTLVDIVTIVSFLSAPIFAWLNISLYKTRNTSKAFLVCCYLGLAYFVVFSIAFLLSRLDVF